VNAKDKCALIFQFRYQFCVVFCCSSSLLIFCSSGQRSALHLAAGHGNTVLCKLLIANKADVDEKDGCAFIF
jgi:hypothetical protein